MDRRWPCARRSAPGKGFTHPARRRASQRRPTTSSVAARGTGRPAARNSVYRRRPDRGRINPQGWPYTPAPGQPPGTLVERAAPSLRPALDGQRRYCAPASSIVSTAKPAARCGRAHQRAHHALAAQFLSRQVAKIYLGSGPGESPGTTDGSPHPSSETRSGEYA